MIQISKLISAVADLIAVAFHGETVYTNRVRKDFARPSCLVSTEKLLVQPLNQGYEQRTVEVCITTFVQVDERHDSHFQTLIDRAEHILAVFAPQIVPVGSRSLSVSGASCEYGFDFAEVRISLTWSEEVDFSLKAPIAEQYKLYPERLEC